MCSYTHTQCIHTHSERVTTGKHLSYGLARSFLFYILWKFEWNVTTTEVRCLCRWKLSHVNIWVMRHVSSFSFPYICHNFESKKVLNYTSPVSKRRISRYRITGNSLLKPLQSFSFYTNILKTIGRLNNHDIFTSKLLLLRNKKERRNNSRGRTYSKGNNILWRRKYSQSDNNFTSAVHNPYAAPYTTEIINIIVKILILMIALMGWLVISVNTVNENFSNECTKISINIKREKALSIEFCWCVAAVVNLILFRC